MSDQSGEANSKLLLSVFDQQAGRTLAFLETHAGILEDSLPPPAIRHRGEVTEFRYQEQTPEVALFLKLCRSISLLSAHRLMVAAGMVQEQGILQRVIDETDEDILFLTMGIERGLTTLHRDYLNAFWAEEFDVKKPIRSTRRPMIPRKKIRAYVNGTVGHSNLAEVNEVGRTIHSTYSGFVHGAAPHIMDLFDPTARRFRLRGMPGTPTHDTYVLDAANYPYRVTMSLVVVAMGLRINSVSTAGRIHMAHLEKWLGLFNAS